ncbi:hypothetical protein [Flavobacterium wongokense]|uniref:hypothetical protein n=1 Tax=Flavobacterium wongokense TaxID=2910674 RepID=UPI001F3D904A|nr:hypothetical protein [Flavobacterium sp. WG47]MCF6133099.1 hypothetical protein [Flavobacterium sp. WG47]
MKTTVRNIILLLHLFTAIAAYSQPKDQNKEIEAVFYNYIHASKSDNEEEELKFLYEEQFDEYPKTLFMSMHETRKSITTIDEKIYRISKTLEKANIKYVKISYKVNWIFDFKENKDPDNVNYFIERLEYGFGKDSVTVDKKNFKAIAKYVNYVYAAFNPKYNGWKIVLPEIVGDGSTEGTKWDAIPQEILQKLIEM